MKTNNSTNVYILNGNVDSVFHPKIKMKVFDSFVNIGKSDICLTLSNELIDFIHSSVRFAACCKNKDKRDDFICHINEILNNFVTDELYKNIICSISEKENEIKILNSKNDIVFKNINNVVEHINHDDDNVNRPYYVIVELNADDNNFDILFFKSEPPTYSYEYLLCLKCEFIN